MTDMNAASAQASRRIRLNMLLSAGLGAILAGALVWLLAARQVPATDVDGEEIMARLQALEERSAGPLGRAVASSAGAARADQAAYANLENAGEKQLTPGQMAARKAAMDAEFSRLPQDPSAGQRELEMLEGMTDARLANAGVLPADPVVDCKQDACRVSATFRSESEATDWATLYLTTGVASFASQARQAAVQMPDGRMRITLFVAK